LDTVTILVTTAANVPVVAGFVPVLLAFRPNSELHLTKRQNYCHYTVSKKKHPWHFSYNSRKRWRIFI